MKKIDINIGDDARMVGVPVAEQQSDWLLKTECSKKSLIKSHFDSAGNQPGPSSVCGGHQRPRPEPGSGGKLLVRGRLLLLGSEAKPLEEGQSLETLMCADRYQTVAEHLRAVGREPIRNTRLTAAQITSGIHLEGGGRNSKLQILDHLNHTFHTGDHGMNPANGCVSQSALPVFLIHNRTATRFQSFHIKRAFFSTHKYVELSNSLLSWWPRVDATGSEFNYSLSKVTVKMHVCFFHQCLFYTG